MQVATVEATRGEVAASAMKLEEELEHTKRVQGETAERLVSRSADIQSVTRSLASINVLLEWVGKERMGWFSVMRCQVVKGQAYYMFIYHFVDQWRI